VPAVDFASLLLPELTERGSGGLIERGDIHQAILENLGMLGVSLPTLNPDELAETVVQRGVTVRGIVDRTGSPNRARTPSLNVT
jgi:hypothetical protein